MRTWSTPKPAAAPSTRRRRSRAASSDKRHLHLASRSQPVHKSAMPGAGTDKTKNWIERPGPIVVLVEPQLGENIGAAARVMANFGLSRLRVVAPRQGWPNPKAHVMAAGADRVLNDAQVFGTLAEAIAD